VEGVFWGSLPMSVDDYNDRADLLEMVLWLIVLLMAVAATALVCLLWPRKRCPECESRMSPFYYLVTGFCFLPRWQCPNCRAWFRTRKKRKKGKRQAMLEYAGMIAVVLAIMAWSGDWRRVSIAFLVALLMAWCVERIYGAIERRSCR